jgi:CPA2 family monovalent cation:H+ antiporter-2
VTVLARRSDEEGVRAALLEPFERPPEADEGAARVLEASPAEAPGLGPGGEAPAGVVLLGHGRVGAVLAGLLRQRRLPFAVVEQDETTVEQLRRAGTRVVLGDGSEPDVLRQAGVAAARLLVVTSAEPLGARRAIEQAQRLNPTIEVVARVHHEAHRRALAALPRTQCVQGEAELAYAMARLMLLTAGVSVVETEALVLDARRGGGEAGRPRTRIAEILVPGISPVVGRTLADLGLPRGALVVTIARAGEFVVPNGATVIQADDALLVLADAETAHAIETRVLEPRPAG